MDKLFTATIQVEVIAKTELFAQVLADEMAKKIRKEFSNNACTIKVTLNQQWKH